MSLNATEIGQVVRSLERDILGASIREIISERDVGQITLLIRKARENHYLRFAMAADATRLGRIPNKPRATPDPHPFVMLLRKMLIGKRIHDISQLNGDRVVALTCKRDTDAAVLVAELTSRHANLFLLDTDRVIYGALFPNRTGRRALRSGQPYVPPPLHGEAPMTSRFSDGSDLEFAIDVYYRDLRHSNADAALKATIEKMIRTAEKKTRRLTEKLGTDLEHAETGETLFSHGHILKANLNAVAKGASRLDTTDFEGNAVVIALDPTLSPVVNMERLFKKAKRLTRAVDQIEERLLDAMATLEDLDQTASQVQEATHVELLQMQSRLLRRFPFLKPIAAIERGALPPRLPYREYRISGSRLARVGRSAKDNDTLTLRHTRPHDLWLHVRSETGSHVVVPLERNETPLPELLVDAAHLAAHFSKLKNERDVEVLYTYRRYVQKPKGAPPGSVRLMKEKTIYLRIEPERLRRILNAPTV